MAAPIDVMRLTAGTCWMCTAPAFVRIDTEDDETRDAVSTSLCREHAREHARAVLRICHDVPAREAGAAKGAV